MHNSNNSFADSYRNPSTNNKLHVIDYSNPRSKKQRSVGGGGGGGVRQDLSKAEMTLLVERYFAEAGTRDLMGGVPGSLTAAGMMASLPDDATSSAADFGPQDVQLMDDAAVPVAAKRQFATVRMLRRRIVFLMNQQRCPSCWLEPRCCVCSHLTKMSSSEPEQQEEEDPSLLLPRFFLYMHPKEFLRSSNSGKLILRTLPVASRELLIAGIEAHDMRLQDVCAAAPHNTVILFPSDDSVGLDEWLIAKQKKKEEAEENSAPAAAAAAPLNVVLFDGTWRQANSLRRQFQADGSVGARIPLVHLPRGEGIAPTESLFAPLRRQSRPRRISSIEAVAQVINTTTMQQQSSSSAALISNLCVLVDALQIQKCLPQIHNSFSVEQEQLMRQA
jgi:DTW domain-containing protein YfiP